MAQAEVMSSLRACQPTWLFTVMTCSSYFSLLVATEMVLFKLSGLVPSGTVLPCQCLLCKQSLVTQSGRAVPS